MSNARLVIALVIGIAAFQYFSGRGGHSAGIGSDAVVAITPDNMEAALFKSTEPVLAYFWAPW